MTSPVHILNIWVASNYQTLIRWPFIIVSNFLIELGYQHGHVDFACTRSPTIRPPSLASSMEKRMRETMLLPMATPLPTATPKPMAAILLQPTVPLPPHFCGYLPGVGEWVACIENLTSKFLQSTPVMQTTIANCQARARKVHLSMQ
jgi:hypothetical protein